MTSRARFGFDSSSLVVKVRDEGGGAEVNLSCGLGAGNRLV